MADDLDLKSDFEDGRSNYDLNDYTQGNYDDMIDTGGKASPKVLPGAGKNEPYQQR